MLRLPHRLLTAKTAAAASRIAKDVSLVPNPSTKEPWENLQGLLVAARPIKPKSVYEDLPLVYGYLEEKVSESAYTIRLKPPALTANAGLLVETDQDPPLALPPGSQVRIFYGSSVADGMNLEGLIVKVNGNATYTMLMENNEIELSVSINNVYKREGRSKITTNFKVVELMEWMKSCLTDPRDVVAVSLILYKRGWRVELMYLLEKSDIHCMTFVSVIQREAVIEKAQWERDHHAVVRLLHRDKVVLFPSHGGYNNVTGQLDLYWGCFLGDILRAKHSRAVLDTLASIESYTSAVLSSQSLPSPLLFRATRWSNFTSLWNLLTEDQQLLVTNRHRESIASSFFSHKSNTDSKMFTLVPFHYPKTPLVFLDCRDYAEHHQLHIKGSISVPMSFPTSAFNALKAELWLQCLLLPGQAVAVLCCLENKEEVKKRVALLSPDAFIQVFTLNELIGEDDHQKNVCFASTNAANSTTGNEISDTFCPQTNHNSWFHLFSAPCAVRSTGLGLPETLEWIHNSEPFYRLDTHEKLEAVNPRKTAVVVDVRTPSEFKNGSHQYSIPFTLSAICELSAQDHLASHSSPSPSLSATLMKSLKSKFYHAAKNDVNIAKIVPLATAKDPVGWKDVIFYCAAGYRSLIAISLFRRAFETSYKCSFSAYGTVSSTSNNLNNPSLPWTEILNSIKMVDIPGGALQLMTQRPDLWQVKDRSIICIS